MQKIVVAVLTLVLAGCAGQPVLQSYDSRPVAPKACPNGWTLKADAFSRGELPSDLGEKIDRAIAAANARESHGGTRLEPYFTDSVSRTHGAELHRRVPLADVDANIALRFIDKNADGHLAIQTFGILQMERGTGIFVFQDDPTTHLAISMGWPQFFDSPTASGFPKEPRLRIGRHEWRNRCDLRTSGIVP